MRGSDTAWMALQLLATSLQWWHPAWPSVRGSLDPVLETATEPATGQMRRKKLKPGLAQLWLDLACCSCSSCCHQSNRFFWVSAASTLQWKWASGDAKLSDIGCSSILPRFILTRNLRLNHQVPAPILLVQGIFMLSRPTACRTQRARNFCLSFSLCFAVN